MSSVPPADPPRPDQPHDEREQHEPEHGVAMPPPAAPGQSGQQDSYGTPAYGQPSHDAPAYGTPAPSYGIDPAPAGGASYDISAPAYGYAPTGPTSPWGELASWGPRVGAFLLDRLLGIVPLFVFGIIGGIMLGVSSRTDPLTGQSHVEGPLSVVGFVLIGLGYLSVVVIEIWNRCLRTGRTGQSVGKQVLGLHLLGEQSGQPIGGGMAFVRELCHLVDGLICDVGYLFPLWDAKRQTLADKIVSTVVVQRPKNAPTGS